MSDVALSDVIDIILRTVYLILVLTVTIVNAACILQGHGEATATLCEIPSYPRFRRYTFRHLYGVRLRKRSNADCFGDLALHRSDTVF